MLLYTIFICLPILAFCQDLLANQEFRRFDEDGDGNLRPGEIEEYFKIFDGDSDNRISREEYGVEVNTHHSNSNQADQALLRLFNDIDINHDNHLDRSELDRLFRAADANHNNLVSEQEFVNYFNRITGGPIIG